MEARAAQELANALMAQYGLTNPQMHVNPWRFRFDNSKRRFGVCKYRHKVIGLSHPLTIRNTEAQVRDTILHEIAHALAGHAAGHGPEWKVVCVRIGAKPERCYSSKDVAVPEGKWRATCGACSHTYHRHKAPRFGATYSCPPCKRRNPVAARLTWERPGLRRFVAVPAPAAPVWTPPWATAARTAPAPAPVMPAPAAPAARMFDAARAVALYQGGMKVVDIAVEMGYVRGQGQNRTRTALEAAGVYRRA